MNSIFWTGNFPPFFNMFCMYFSISKYLPGRENFHQPILHVFFLNSVNAREGKTLRTLLTWPGSGS